MYCTSCGEDNIENASFCVSCGTALDDSFQATERNISSKSKSDKNPIIALVLSLIIVGAGQFYNGENKKGLIMLGIAIVGGAISATLIWWIAALWSAVDAYNTAST